MATTVMDDPESRGDDRERRGIRPLTLAVAVLIAIQLAWGAVSCLDASATPNAQAPPAAAAE